MSSSVCGVVVLGTLGSLARPFVGAGHSEAECGNIAEFERKVPERETVGVREERCLKHSWPHGSEYPKQGPVESQLDFVSLTKDITLL